MVYKQTPTEKKSNLKKKTQYADLSRSMPAARNSAALKLYLTLLTLEGSGDSSKKVKQTQSD